MRRFEAPLLAIAIAIPAFAGVKVAGVDFVPKDLIFAAAEPKSRATAEGPLPNECKWSFTSETRIARREEPEGQGCVRFYYRTTVVLEQTCPAPNDKTVSVTRSSERITSEGPVCRDSSGKSPQPRTEARVVSSGTTAEGKHQDIVVQPDGARVTLVYDDTGVVVTVVYTDGTADTLKLP